MRVTVPTSAQVGAVTACVAACLALTSACDSYEAPCEASPTSSVLDESPAPNTLSTLIRFEVSGDLIVATWLTLAISNDEDFPSYRPSLAQVAVMASDGTLVARHSFPLFEGEPKDELERDNLGFCWTPLGLVVHWTQDSTVSAVGEPPSIRTSLRLQRFFPNGIAAAPIAPINMDCVDCAVRLSAACHQGRATVLFSAWPQDDHEPIPIRSIAWDLVEDQMSSGPVDWLGRASPQSPAPALRVDGDVLLLITSDQAWVVDAEVQLRGGPLPLPVPINRQMQWAGDTFEGTVVWSNAGLAPSDVAASDDVFMRRFDGFGQPITPIARLGASARVAALARDGDEIGVILRDDGQDAFAWADVMGTRLGGDVRLGPELRSSGVASGTGEVLFARGAGRFIHVMGVPGQIQRREILCAR